MMKINEKNLSAFASSATPVDHEGWLDMRSDPTKSYHTRWFMLKGNLLFYFDKKCDKEPVGVIILEACTVELTEEEEATYSFKIVFQCENSRTYYLCTDSQSSMEKWMKCLACASYDYMKVMVADLQRQLEEAEAKTAEKQSIPGNIAEEPKAPPRGQRLNPFNKNTDGEKSVHSGRHHKENQKAEKMGRKAVPFRDIHALYGRKILADRSEFRASTVKESLQDAQLITL